MNPRTRAYLTLIRPANVCTAIADVTAGALYMSARWSDWREWMLLAGASALLYAGGVALNDVCDAKRDAVDRPERPIPSGLVPRRQALVLCLVLLMAGVVLAGVFSRLSAGIAGGLVAAIVLYNATLKSTFLGPAAMGLCRALNLALGLSIFPEYRTIPGLTPVLLLMWLFVTSLTAFAKNEHATTSRGRVLASSAGLSVAVVGLGMFLALVPGVHKDYLVGVACLFIFVIWRIRPALRDRDAASVQRTVGALVLSIIVFDACIAWSARGFVWSLAVLVWIIPARILSRRFRVT